MEREWLSKNCMKLRLQLRQQIGEEKVAFHEINQEFESRRLQLHQASRWADQAQRDKISFYGGLELRNRLFREEKFVVKRQIEQDKQELMKGPGSVETARKSDSDMKRESLNTSVPSPHFQSRSGMLNHIGGTYSHNGMMDYPRIPFSEWNLGKFPDSMEFQSWKVNFRTEVCVRTADPQITMLWIKEVGQIN